MEKTVLISLPVEDLQTLIIDCVNSCLKHQPQSSTTQSEADRWFDLTELCNYLPDKPAKATAYGWVHRGLIPHHKKTKKLQFLKSEIDSWIKASRRKTTSELSAEAEQYIQKKRG